MSAANGTPPPSVRRSPHKSNGDATLSPALSLEVKKLRSELRAKATEANDLAVEVRTLQSMIAAKDAAIEAAEGRRAALEEQALQLQGEAAEMRRAATKWELERKRLRAEAAAANAEADRLNQLMLSSAGDNSRVMNGSMEDVVRLHNQLAEARKEIKRLKDDVKGANNVIAAKDAAIDQMQGEIGAAREANAARRDDQNIILDLRRQLAEAHEQLGGEKRLGHIVETEIEDLKAALAAKNEELANSVGYMKSVQEELTAAQMAVAAAERAAALAKVEAANAMALAEKSKVAEAERESHETHSTWLEAVPRLACTTSLRLPVTCSLRSLRPPFLSRCRYGRRWLRQQGHA